MPPAIEAKSVWKLLGRRWVLRGVNIGVEEGEAVVISGPNGSGKSTILKILSGIWSPTKGKVLVLGIPPWTTKAKSILGTVLHENILYEELTVDENLRLHARLKGLDREIWEAAREYLGISRVLDARVGELSFGWKRRVNIAAAVIHGPKVLLIDEPTTGLDTEGRKSITELLRHLLSRGRTVIAASPTLDSHLIRLLDARVYNLHNGVLEG